MTENSKNLSPFFNIFALILAIALAALAINLSGRISKLDYSYQETASTTAAKILILEEQISDLNEKISVITGQSRQTAASIKEIQNKQAIVPKSEQDLVTAAVAKVTPSVVSVVALKDVPQYEVVYQNPFGDDPNFQDFGIRVPVLRQKGTKQSQVGAGTGFFVTSNGFIVTNKHVVADQNASYVAFMPDSTKQDVIVIYRDPVSDVAVLKVPGTNYKPIALGDSGKTKLGQTVIAVGNALGELNNTVSIGIISGLNRSITASDKGSGTTETLTGVIQTDAAINPGNSGGPLVNLDGEAIGVNVATVTSGSNISFSIPINVIKEALKIALGRVF
ncbi:MAG TPA: trypsin-like peptidase domain-containing protein [Candidatus Paceibacterota bacterium]